MINVENSGDLNLVGLSVVKFTAIWCKPCAKLDTILIKMEKEFPEVKLYYVDIEKQSKIAQKYKIMSVPSLLFFNGVDETNRIVGLLSTEPLRKEFKSFIDGKKE